MPRKKLTLTVDEGVIRRAKRFSARHGTSVSELVTRFLGSLEDGAAADTPIVSRLRGILKEAPSEEDYRRHLEEKHGA